MKRSAVRGRRAFTMVELLLVVGIIGVLVAITLVIGRSVSGSAKERLTEQAIRTMFSTLEAASHDAGGAPGPTVEFTNPANPAQQVLQPVADARVSNSAEMVNSVGWYMLQVSRLSGGDGVFQGMDSKLVRNLDLTPAGASPAWMQDQPMMPTAVDAWERPLRYVHPALDGLIHGPDFANLSITRSGAGMPVSLSAVLLAAPSGGPAYGIDEIRRNNVAQGGQSADSDGGICPGNQGYFYSAGPDGDPSTVDDNVYAVRPQIQTAP